MLLFVILVYSVLLICDGGLILCHLICDISLFCVTFFVMVVLFCVTFVRMFILFFVECTDKLYWIYIPSKAVTFYIIVIIQLLQLLSE